MDRVKILFVSANPAGTLQLKLDKEAREIEAKIRAAEYRDSLELITKWAVRPDDLLQALNQHQPHIVHFSGHGNPTEEIVLLDELGKAKPVSTKALVHLFRTLKDNIRVVVLNACFSRPQAEAIAGEIDCAIGMMREIGIKWEPLKEHAKVGGKLYFERGLAVHVAGGGIGQLTQWRRIAESLGIEIRFESPVCAVHGDLRRVEGVAVSAADGRYDLKAKAVIACAGGFQANPEMRARYLAGFTDMMKVRGSKHDTGEVFVVIEGEIWLDEARNGPGSVVYIAPDTDYAVRAGAEGARYFRIVTA